MSKPTYEALLVAVQAVVNAGGGSNDHDRGEALKLCRLALSPEDEDAQ